MVCQNYFFLQKKNIFAQQKFHKKTLISFAKKFSFAKISTTKWFPKIIFLQKKISLPKKNFTKKPVKNEEKLKNKKKRNKYIQTCFYPPLWQRCRKKSVAATIHIGWVILCLLYAGLLKAYSLRKVRCMSVCLSVCLSVCPLPVHFVLGLSLALKSHDQFKASTLLRNSLSLVWRIFLVS